MLVSEFVADVLSYYTNEDETSVLKELNKIHKILCKAYRLRVEEHTLSSFVNGTRYYALPDRVAEVNQATWFYTATASYQPLVETTVQELTNWSAGWRDFGPGSPTQYFVDGATEVGTAGQIGFFMTPDTTSSAGYPACVLSCSMYETLVLDDDPHVEGQSQYMPPNLVNYDAWFYTILCRLSDRNNDNRLDRWELRARRARAQLEGQLAQAHNTRAVGAFSDRFASGGRV